MKQPWLHVVVPAYGPSPYLAAALASVLAAADDGTDVTLLDDGSPDDGVAAAARSAGSRVEYVRLPQNLGVAGAFQECVRRSRGTYTAIMGSDDLMEPWYVAELRALADRFDEPAMLTPTVVVIDESGATVRPPADRVKSWLAPHSDEPRLLAGDPAAATLLTGNWLYFPAMAWRTDVLRRHGFRQDMHTALDLDLELRILLEGGALAWSPRASFRYRRHGASASSQTAASGDRFDEERALYGWAASASSAQGWRRSRWAARLHATSRLHALLAKTRKRG
jgi:GT2 family glycosyltransferase